jgi:pilus assembly protein Flp/PilA
VIFGEQRIGAMPLTFSLADRTQRREIDMIRNLIRSTRAVATDRKGVTAAEYAILAVGVVIIVGAAATAFGPSLKTAFQTVGTQITAQQTAVSGAVSR